MHQMEQRDVEFFAPVSSNLPQADNPARRDDPTQSVAESERMPSHRSLSSTVANNSNAIQSTRRSRHPKSHID